MMMVAHMIDEHSTRIHMSMTSTIINALAAYIPRDRIEQFIHPETALANDGVAMIADISGFTPLTEALAGSLNADRGAEELTAALDRVFIPLVEAIHSYRGSVLKFSGDALIVWFARPARTRPATSIRRAIAAALGMQQVMTQYGSIPTPIGPVVLRMKIGLAYGPLRRFVLGLTEYGYEDVPGGNTLERMSAAEHHAEPGDIIADEPTIALVREAVIISAWRGTFALIGGLHQQPRRAAWPEFAWGSASEAALIEQLTHYIPPQIARIIMSGRTQVAELKPVVSLFVQFHGIDYDSDPQIAERLQAYFALAQQIVARYGGRLNRLITGDKGSLLHIIFGAPTAIEEREIRATRCALDLQRECGSMPFISMQRIGMAGGRVFAGPVGGPVRHDYTTMGDAINLSARLMQNAADNQILIDTSVQSQLNIAFTISDLGQIRVKGKAEPIQVFAVLAFHETLARQRPAPQIYGRDQERAQLRNLLANFQQGGIVILTGEVGVGKTMMIAALQAEASTIESPPRWLSAIALAYGQTLSGYLFIDIVRELLDLQAGMGPDEAHLRLRALCIEYFGAAELDGSYPYLVRFMSLPPGNESRRLEGISGESLRWRIFTVLRALFRQIAARRPLILALDDLQWADPTSLELIEALVSLTREVPITLLLAMRPERESRAWALRQQILAQPDRQPGGLGELTLGDFDSTTAQQVVRQLAPNLSVPIVALVAEKSGGNPLFLGELVRALIARGPDAALETDTLETLGLPDTIQGLLLAQIDRLDSEAHHLLQIASVIGPTFLTQVLILIADAEQSLELQLAELYNQDLIQPYGDNLDEHRFRHILVQESAYSTLLYERRRAYHRQIALALTRLFPERAIEQAGLLAYHYERADDLEQAVTLLIRAADSARLLAANTEAEALYRRALNLLDQLIAAGANDDPDQRARIYLKLAQVRSNTGDFAGAQDYYDQAFTLLEEVEAAKPPVQRTAENQRHIRLGVFEHGPATLDPGLLKSSGDAEIIRDLFEGLVELDTDLNVIPALARRWNVDQTGQLYRFELRPGLRWSDGTILTAHDVVFAWRRNLDPTTGAGLASSLLIVEGGEAFYTGASSDPTTIGIHALDDQTLEVTLAMPAGYFLYLLDHPITYPQPRHIFDQYGIESFTPQNIVCNGAFRLQRWESGVGITLERNPFYNGFSAGNLDHIELFFVEPRLPTYLANTIDLCRIEDRSDIPQLYPDNTSVLQYLETYFIGFACSTTLFNRTEARRAFGQSIDRNDLVQQIWSGVQKPATGGIVPPGMPGHTPEIGLAFDPEAARQALSYLLDQPDQPHQPIRLAALPGTKTMPEYLQASWLQHLNIAVEIIKDLPVDAILHQLRQGDIHMALMGYDAEYPDPGTILRVVFHSNGSLNYFNWRNAEFDHLVDQAATLANKPAQLELYHQADRLLVVDHVAVVPLFYHQSYLLLRSNFRFAEPSRIIRGGNFRLKYIIQEE